jgi:hypothetical protein
MNKREWVPLFSKYDLRAVLEAKAKQVSDRVAKISADRITQNDTEPLVSELLKQLSIEPLSLRENDISVDSAEAKVWPNYERQQAQARALKNRGEYVLPARFEDTEVPGLPDSVAYVDLRRLTPQGLVNRILAKLGHGS